MKMIKSYLVGAAAAAAIFTCAHAQSFGMMPADYQYSAQDYIESRLVNARGMSLRFAGQPYPVYATFRGGRRVPAWAVDVQVRARLESRRSGRTMYYSVIFVDGEPVAFADDIYDVEEAQRDRRVAGR